MPQAVDSIATEVQELAAKLRDLERRVAILEKHPEQSVPQQGETATVPPALQRPTPPATWRGFPPVEFQSGAVPIVGKAILGIAGAYVFRALADSGKISKLPVLIVAIIYAAWWMVLAVRSHDANRFTSIAYGSTSVLILSPLLWESTVRFEAISPTFAALVLVAFVVLTLALAWQRNLQALPWIATLAIVITALALIIATHDLVPLTTALLVVSLVTEIAACAGHRLRLRAIPAIAADFAVWLVVYLMTSSLGVPETYRPVGSNTLTLLCLALLAIYGGSIGIRGFVLLERISIFEVAQGVLAFLLATWGTLRVAREGTAPVLGLLFLLLAAVNYWGTLSRFTGESYMRNRRVSAAWAVAVLLAGTFLFIPGRFQVPFLCVAALAAGFLYSRTRKLSLGLHTSFYLVAAAALSSLSGYVANAVAGTVPGAPDSSLWMVVVCALLCYVIGARSADDQRKRRLLWLIPAALTGFAAAALAIAATVFLASRRVDLTASYLSVIRTIINCTLALAFGFAGSRWKRIELGWIAYAAVGFGTLKLLFEDLRFGNASSLVVSLVFYGSILIFLPRLARHGGATP